MKATLKLGLTFITLLMGGLSSTGAQPTNKPVFWVVEGNVKQPDYTIVKLYDRQMRLVREERVEGRFLDIRKRRDKRLLNRRLEDWMRPEPQVAVHRNRNR